MNVPIGRTVDIDSPASIRSAVSTLVEELKPPTGADPIVVPDLSYPFHPSTGLVTNPEVAVAVVVSLRSQLNATVGIVFAGSPEADGARTASLLGLDEISRGDGVELVDCSSAEQVERTVGVGDEERTISLPAPLVDRPVIVVPTLRYGRGRAIAGGMSTIARCAGVSPTAGGNVAAAALAVDPAGVVLDATYTYTGEPHRTGVLIAGGDVVTMDGISARLVRSDPADVPAIAALQVGDPTPESIRSLSIDTVRDAIPNVKPPDRGAPGPLVREGYRLYTRVTGDAYPPQFEP